MLPVRPSWLTLTASEIAQDSRLQANQVGSTVTPEEFESDIDTQLLAAAADVSMRLRRAADPLRWPFTPEQFEVVYPDETGAERLERSSSQIIAAEAAVRALVISSFYQTLPGEDNDRLAKSLADGRGAVVSGDPRLGSAESTLKGLESDIRGMAVILAAHAGKKKRRRGVILTGRGYYNCNST